MENTAPLVYGKMSMAEIKELRKNFFHANSRAKIFRLILLIMIIPLVALIVYTGYNIFQIYNGNTVAWFMTTNYVFVLYISIFVSLALNIEKSFMRWLWLDKGILSKVWKKPKSPALIEKPYKELSKPEKRQLRKDYLNSVGKSSKYWTIFIALLFIIMIFLLTQIFLYFHWKTLISRTTGILASGMLIIFLYNYLLFANYTEWLEYEKAIIRQTS